MMMTAWWPSSWNSRILRSGTVWPRWTSMPVGSMPYLTRRGLPVFRLRSSFWRSSASGTICSAPRWIRASCSSRVFTGASTVHLESTDRLEGLTVVDDDGFALTRRPADGQHVEAGGMVEQAMAAQIVQGQHRQAALLGLVHRRRRAGRVVAAGRAHLDEYHR